MTVNGAIKAGFAMWQDGWGWWASDGKRQVGPCKTRQRMLDQVEDLVEGRIPPAPADPDGVPVAEGFPTQSFAPRAQESMLCLGCNRIMPPDTEWVKARCPDCRKGK